jgi:ubiquinone biosynthesis protein UbiJ
MFEAATPAKIAAQVANRALASEQSLRTRMAAHAGSVLRIVASPAAIVFSVNADGTLAQAAHDATPTLVLNVRPSGIAALLHDPARFDELVQAEGDGALAATIRDLSATMPWFVERLFGQAFGAIAGQRLADAGRRLLGLPEYAATHLEASVGSYVRDEAQIAVAGADITAFGGDIHELAMRVDTLAERIDRIAAARKP